MTGWVMSWTLTYKGSVVSTIIWFVKKNVIYSHHLLRLFSLQRPHIIKDMQHLPTNALKHLFGKKKTIIGINLNNLIGYQFFSFTPSRYKPVRLLQHLIANFTKRETLQNNWKASILTISWAKKDFTLRHKPNPHRPAYFVYIFYTNNTMNLD
jgi:hypothetical protein